MIRYFNVIVNTVIFFYWDDTLLFLNRYWGKWKKFLFLVYLRQSRILLVLSTISIDFGMEKSQWERNLVNRVVVLIARTSNLLIFLLPNDFCEQLYRLDGRWYCSLVIQAWSHEFFHLSGQEDVSCIR